MTDINTGHTIKIERKLGITHALKASIESNTNAVISDGKITASEWDATLNKLIEINNRRKANGQTSIFTGGIDKSRAGWQNSFIVHPDAEITFTKEESDELYAAMGVSFKTAEAPQQKEEIEQQEQTPLDQNEQNVPSDSTKVDTDKQPLSPADSSKLEAPKDSIKPTPTDSTLVAPIDTTKVTPKDTNKTPQASMPIDKTTEVENGKNSNRLSWGEIGKIAKGTCKNFFKNMFCNEEGKFSLGKTAAIVGTGVALAFAAPIAAALGAGAALVTGVAAVTNIVGISMLATGVIMGVRDVAKGTYNYYNADSKQEAAEAMVQACAGGIELGVTAALAGVFKAGSWILGKIPRIKRARKIETIRNERHEALHQQHQQQNAPVQNNTQAQKPKRSKIEQMQRNNKARKIKQERAEKAKQERIAKEEQARKAEQERVAQEERARQIEEAQRAREAEEARLAEETRIAERERRMAEVNARQVEVTEETYPQMKAALEAELRNPDNTYYFGDADYAVTSVLDDIDTIMMMSPDEMMPVNLFATFLELPNGKIALELAGKTFIFKRGVNVKPKAPKTPVVEPKPVTQEVKPIEVKPVEPQGTTTVEAPKIAISSTYTCEDSAGWFKLTKTSATEGTMTVENQSIISELLGSGVCEPLFDIYYNPSRGVREPMKILKPAKMKLEDGVWKIVEKIQLEIPIKDMPN